MVTLSDFGCVSGRKATLYTIKNGKFSVSVSDFGATVVHLFVPDANGELTDVVIGLASAEDYENDDCYFGATVGRFANRIPKGRFTLGKKEYSLFVNDGPNHMHGGKVGFNRRFFDIEILSECSIAAHLVSEDGDEGFPGTLDFKVVFSLSDKGEFSIEYFAKSDKDTVVNFTNHSYFNLAGFSSPLGVETQYLQVFADAYLPSDKYCMANGKIAPVKNTRFDLRRPTYLANVLIDKNGNVYDNGRIDHNYVLDIADKRVFKKAASFYSPESGILMETYTDMPGMQLYIANTLYPKKIKGGKKMRYSALCLETQNFPGSTEYSYFPSPVLKAGESFYSKTEYRFFIA